MTNVLTVKQMLDILIEYPEDAKVYATWEGQKLEIREKDIAIADPYWGPDGPEILIDVDNFRDL